MLNVKKNTYIYDYTVCLVCLKHIYYTHLLPATAFGSHAHCENFPISTHNKSTTSTTPNKPNPKDSYLFWHTHSCFLIHPHCRYLHMIHFTNTEYLRKTHCQGKSCKQLALKPPNKYCISYSHHSRTSPVWLLSWSRISLPTKTNSIPQAEWHGFSMPSCQSELTLWI